MINNDLSNTQYISDLVYLHSNLQGLSYEFPINEINITYNNNAIKLPNLIMYFMI